MKKITLFILIGLLIIPFSLYAQEDDVPADAAGNVFTWDDDDEEIELVEIEKGWIQDRGFEVGLLYLNDIHVANNILSLNQIFSEEINIKLNKIPSVMSAQLGLGIRPLFINYDSKNGWGIGLETGIQALGFLGINADLPIIRNANNKKSDVGAAAFINISPNGFFNFNDFKISVKPTLFFPAVYSKSNVSYTLNGDDTYAEAVYDINIYLPIDGNDNFSMPSPGFDLSASVEYPLSEKLYLSEIHSLLNFDIGASITSVPIVPGTMKNYENIRGKFTIAKNNSGYVDYDPTKGDDEFITQKESISESLTGSKSVFRPFTMHTWADWRPLETELLTVTPLIGFSVNPLYIDPASLEAGISGLLNLNNLFYTKLGINRFDRMWINSLDLALNLRIVELNLGLSLRSQEFLKSWTFSGFGMSFGLMFGW